MSQGAPEEILGHDGRIYIPPGPRLGDVVIDVGGVRKSFGDRLLMEGLEFSLPPAGIVGVIGPNGKSFFLSYYFIYPRYIIYLLFQVLESRR
mmetsp:Transcript_36247/g.84784  ORF Transcript_36247/g.84784 Transcript_36247/m.84784 type:complete len:92 (-) Transcript_36247:813-1088(-)